MAFARLNATSTNSTTSSVTAAFPTPGAGHGLVAWVVSNQPAGNNAMSGWTKGPDTGFSSNSQAITIFYKVSAGNETSITATCAGATVMNIAIAEYSGNGGAMISTGTETDTTVAALAGTSGIITDTASAGGLTVFGWGFAGNNSGYSNSSGYTNVSTAQARLYVNELITTTSGSRQQTANWASTRASGDAGQSFRIGLAPTVTTTSPATSITTSGATLSGNVTAAGDSTITQRGVAVAITANPTTSNATFTTTGTTGTFSVSATSLAPGTTYHFRAYAINGGGTSYGADQTFTTLTAPGFFVFI